MTWPLLENMSAVPRRIDQRALRKTRHPQDGPGLIHISVSATRRTGAPAHYRYCSDISVQATRGGREQRGGEAANHAKDEFWPTSSRFADSHERHSRHDGAYLDTSLTDDQRQCLRTVKPAGLTICSGSSMTARFLKDRGRQDGAGSDGLLATASSATPMPWLRSPQRSELVSHVQRTFPTT